MATTLSSVRFLITILVPSFATQCLLTSLSHLRPHLRLQLRLMLFGVRVQVDPMSKSVSMTILSQYEQPQCQDDSNVADVEQPQCQDDSNVADVACGDSGYASADEAVHPQSLVRLRTTSSGEATSIGVAVDPASADEAVHPQSLVRLRTTSSGEATSIGVAVDPASSTSQLNRSLQQ